MMTGKPQYELIADELRAKYRDAPPGTALPSGPELVVRYGASRTTIARARDVLMREGWLAAETGRGTFVLGPDGQPGVRALKAEQVYHNLRDQIRNLEHGKTLLPMAWLAGTYEVSEATMRRVLNRLRDDGYLTHVDRRWKVWNPKT